VVTAPNRFLIASPLKRLHRCLYLGTLPGSKYNLGRTLTHEAGHWAGLYHTFQVPICRRSYHVPISERDSRVDARVQEMKLTTPLLKNRLHTDVPRSAIHALVEAKTPSVSPFSGTFKHESLLMISYLPTENFMDYTDDSCMTGFSKGQAKHMKAQLRTYREVCI